MTACLESVIDGVDTADWNGCSQFASFCLLAALVLADRGA